MGKKQRNSEFEGMVSPLTSPDNKKKRRKQDDSFSQESGLEEDLASVSKGSPKKKKKKSSIVNAEVVGSPSKSEKHDLQVTVSSWNRSEADKLLDMVLEQATSGSAKRKKTYISQLKLIPWETISKEFPNRLPEECLEALNSLFGRLNTIKNLQMLIGEAKKFISDDFNFQKIRFQNSYGFKAFVETTDSKESSSELHEQWKKLTKEKKMTYIKACDHKRTGPKMYLLPLALMRKKIESVTDLSNKNALEIHNEIFKKYSSLTDESKLKIIKKCIQQMDKYLEEHEELKKKDPSWQLPQLKYPPKHEMEFYLKKALDMPEKPPRHAVHTYFFNHKKPKEAITATNNLDKYGILKKHYMKLSEQVIQKNEEEHKELVKKYEEDLACWKTQQSPAAIMWFDRLYPSKPKKIAKIKSPKKAKKSKKKKWVEMVSSLTTVKFKDEPSRPLLKGNNIYFEKATRHLDQAGKREWNKTAKSSWESLSEEKRNLYTEKAAKNKEKYKEALLDYVDDLDSEQLKLYLGARRKTLHSVLGSDIFEEKYPNKTYPVYVLSKTEVSDDEEDQDKEETTTTTSDNKSKPSVNRSKVEDSSSESEDLEEERPVKNLIKNSNIKSKKNQSMVQEDSSDSSSSSSESESDRELKYNVVKPKVDKDSDLDVSDDDFDVAAPTWKNTSTVKQHDSDDSDDESD